MAVPDILAGLDPHPGDHFNPRPRDLEALREFMRLGQSLGARPKLHVFYDREAYVNDFNNEVRVTLDRQVKARPRLDGLLPTTCDDAYECSPEGLVILELKFTSRFPGWYRELVETFGLTQTGAAKYVEGANLHLARGLAPKDVLRGLWL
jgi:hypothetical protein